MVVMVRVHQHQFMTICNVLEQPAMEQVKISLTTTWSTFHSRQEGVEMNTKPPPILFMVVEGEESLSMEKDQQDLVLQMMVRAMELEVGGEDNVLPRTMDCQE